MKRKYICKTADAPTFADIDARLDALEQLHAESGLPPPHLPYCLDSKVTAALHAREHRCSVAQEVRDMVRALEFGKAFKRAPSTEPKRVLSQGTSFVALEDIEKGDLVECIFPGSPPPTPDPRIGHLCWVWDGPFENPKNNAGILLKIAVGSEPFILRNGTCWGHAELVRPEDL